MYKRLSYGLGSTYNVAYNLRETLHKLIGVRLGRLFATRTNKRVNYNGLFMII